MTMTVARQAPARPAGLKIVAATVLAVAFAGWLEPRLLTDPAGLLTHLIQRMQLARVATSAPLLKGEPMSIHSGADGTVWVASKYAVVRYPQAETARAVRVLDSESYRARFHRRMHALSTLHVAPHSVWVGTWYGEVLRLHDGNWTRISDRANGPIGRINAVLEHDGVAYVAADGLWAWSRDANALRTVQSFPRRTVTALARSGNGELLAGTREALFVRHQGVWRELWHAAGDDGGVSAVHVARDGRLLVATHDGFEVLDAAGQALYRDLQGMQVTGFVELPDDSLWVSTRHSGVHVHRLGRWRRIGNAEGLGADGIGALAADAGQRLWLAVPERGVSVFEAARLEEFAVEQRTRQAIAAARAYVDACAAAIAEIGANRASGGVSVDTVAGQTAVYFDTRQVCPAGVGYRRDGETLVTIADDVVRFRSRGRERLLPLPARAVGAEPSAAFVDSRSGLWLGFRSRGLFLYRDSTWRAFGRASQLADNDVRAIAEDGDGAIWVATRPRFDAASGRYLHAGLHRFDGRRWKHFRPTRREHGELTGSAYQGLAGASANAVRVLAGGRIAVGTNGGLSIYENGLFSNYVRAAFPGLGSNFIEDVVEDAHGRLWLTHGTQGHGISWQSGFLFRSRGVRDGLLHDRVDALAFDDRGNIWVRSSYGEAVVYPLASLLD